MATDELSRRELYAERSSGGNGRTGQRRGPDYLITPPAQRASPVSLDQLVGDAAQQITRLLPAEASSASAAKAGLIIDIRSQDARELQGVIPGSLHIPRTVLEWRVAPESPWYNRHAGGPDQHLILICDHGYSSILAASNLVQLGLHRTADVIGGFEAWVADGLSVVPFKLRPSAVGALPGSGPPEPPLTVCSAPSGE